MENVHGSNIPLINQRFFDVYYGTVPIILNFPHSGRLYPKNNLKHIIHPQQVLRIFEDPYLDILLPQKQRTDTSILINHYARVFIDVNRSIKNYPLCPVLTVCPFSNNAETGLIPLSLPCGSPLYMTHRLSELEINNRINTYYTPYHDTLKNLIAYKKKLFSHIILIDCHSMPSHGDRFDPDAFKIRPDIIISDNFGNSASEDIVSFIEQRFFDMGLSVFRNFPFAGGHIIRSYGKKSQGVHAVQIEINRQLYMDNHTFSLSSHASIIADKFQNMIQKLVAFLLEFK